MTTAAAVRAAGLPAPGLVPELLEHSLLYVTGKGGAGKTTVAAALGLTAAARSRRTVVCDLAGSDQLTGAFGQPAARHEAVALAAGLWSLSVDPQEALEEWLRRQPGGAAAVAVLTRSEAFAHFVAAAPGAKELVTIGKAIDLARPVSDPPFDLVIADAPSTGHALGMLDAPRTLGEVARLGSVGGQARELGEFLRDPALAGYVGVALPEAMPVEEVLELDQHLPDTAGRPLDLIVVNGVYPDRFSDQEAEQIRRVAQRFPIARAALAQHRRARAHAAQVARLREHARAAVVTLPYLFVPRLGPAEYRALSRDWREAPSGS
jgi:Anion-transporting ATPase